MGEVGVGKDPRRRRTVGGLGRSAGLRACLKVRLGRGGIGEAGGHGKEEVIG